MDVGFARLTRLAVEHSQTNAKQNNAPRHGKGLNTDAKSRQDWIAQPEDGHHDHRDGDGGLNGDAPLFRSAAPGREGQKQRKIRQWIEQRHQRRDELNEMGLQGGRGAGRSLAV